MFKSVFKCRLCQGIVEVPISNREAKNIANRVIGIADPLSVYVDTYGTVVDGKTDKDLIDIIIKNFNLKPGVIIKDLKLTRPIFAKTAVGGHFGRKEPEFLWEIPKILS